MIRCSRSAGKAKQVESQEMRYVSHVTIAIYSYVPVGYLYSNLTHLLISHLTFLNRNFHPFLAARASILFLLVAFSPRSVSALDSAMAVNMPQTNNFQIGMTVDRQFRTGYASPFTKASMEAFEAEWERQEWEQRGTFTMTTDIVSNIHEFREALDIDSSLSVSFMEFSVCWTVSEYTYTVSIRVMVHCTQADAHLNFAKENVVCEMDVAVIMRALAEGKKKQMDVSGINLLEMDTTEAANLDDYLKRYGVYVIVGFEYGGEILFQSTHTSSSKEDTLAVEAGLEYEMHQIIAHVYVRV